jgi:hypothetical protein
MLSLPKGSLLVRTWLRAAAAWSARHTTWLKLSLSAITKDCPTWTWSAWRTTICRLLTELLRALLSKVHVVHIHREWFRVCLAEKEGKLSRI